MRRDITGWYCPQLFREMPLVAYGHYGAPVLMLPTAAADFLEYERFHLVESVRPFIDQGKVKLYSVDSVNKLALLNDGATPQEKLSWLRRYDGYLTGEVLPYIRHDCGGGDVKPVLFGISLGAYLAANAFFRHPDLFGGCILISGSYDVRPFFDGFYNEDLYFNNPVDYLSQMGDGSPLHILRHGGRGIVIFSGQGAYEDPGRARRLSAVLSTKGIPHQLDIWGHDVNHDWPWWRKCVPQYFGQLFG